jgi:ParB-like chromosome segregation protein Spo0J
MQHTYQVMPPLSSPEYAALKADIKANGVHIPIDVDDEGNTLDGFHRQQICEELGRECPKRVLPGLSEAQKREHAYRMNLMRRHLSKKQKIEIAGKLRLEGWTQDAIAKNLDCSQPTASRWINQFMQTHKLPQPDRIQGKDGKEYPPEKAPKSAKQQADGTGTAEMASMSPTPSQDPSTDVDARLAEKMQQQDVRTASDIKPERPVSRNAGVEAEAADRPNASSPDNRTIPAVERETAASPMGRCAAAGIDDAKEQSWVRGLEALSAQVQALQVQVGGPRLNPLWPPETRSRCLDIIRCLKEVMTKWEEMIAHENGRAVKLEGHADGRISTGADQPTPKGYMQFKPNHTGRKPSKKILNSRQLDLLDADSGSKDRDCSW